MNSPAKAPAFQFYAADYLCDERVMLMSLEEEGAYIRLLCLCWREGSIPADTALLQRLCKGASTEVIETVRACFIPHPENPQRLLHPRLEDEREKQREWREKSAEGGRKSAEKRRESAGTKGIVKPAKSAKGGAKGGCTLQSSSSSSSSGNNTPLPPEGDRSSSSDLFGIESHSRKRRQTPIPDALRQRIGGMVGRRPHTTWSAKELKALREIGPIDSEDLDLLEGYYLADIPEEKDYRRRSLARLLVHWHGEIDHARHYTALQRAA